jgi:preprotein translocase subunit SecG
MNVQLLLLLWLILVCIALVLLVIFQEGKSLASREQAERSFLGKRKPHDGCHAEASVIIAAISSRC